MDIETSKTGYWIHAFALFHIDTKHKQEILFTFLMASVKQSSATGNQKG